MFARIQTDLSARSFRSFSFVRFSCVFYHVHIVDAVIGDVVFILLLLANQTEWRPTNRFLHGLYPVGGTAGIFGFDDSSPIHIH